MAVTVANLLERIEAAGIPAQWVRNNIFPHWWDRDCDEAANHNAAMMTTLEVTLVRVLGVTVEDLRDEDAELTLKLDYAPRSLLLALRSNCRATHLGLTVTLDGYVNAVLRR